MTEAARGQRKTAKASGRIGKSPQKTAKKISRATKSREIILDVLYEVLERDGLDRKSVV